MAHRQPTESVYPQTSGCTTQDLGAGEWFTLVASEKRGRSTMPYFRAHSSRMNPPDSIFKFRSFDAFKLLCNSLEAIKMEPLSVPLDTPRGRSRLERLPPEILGSIFSTLESENPNHFISLTLCSQSLWAVAMKWARNGYVIWKNAYSLAGTPVMYASSRLKTLPPCLYRKYPNAVPEETREEDEDEDGEVSDSQPRVVTRATAWLDNILLQSYRAPFSNHDSYVKSFNRMITMANIPDHLHESMRSCLPTMTIEKGSKWLLLNLTNNEYVQMRGVITEVGEGTLCHESHNWLTLDMLLLWLITWRGDQSNLWSWEELEGYVGKNLDDMINALVGIFDNRPRTDDFWPIWNGNWAGHSLEVVTERDLDEAWVDRTEEIDRFSQRILPMLYILSCEKETPQTKAFWEWAISTRGFVDDEVWKIENPDDNTYSYETHAIISVGAIKRHANWLCRHCRNK
ncbi:hypothetical protein FSHL1_012760 [Fusarium sambucinum]